MKMFEKVRFVNLNLNETWLREREIQEKISLIFSTETEDESETDDESTSQANLTVAILDSVDPPNHNHNHIHSSNHSSRHWNGFGLEIRIRRSPSTLLNQSDDFIKEVKGLVVYQLTELLLEEKCLDNLPIHLKSGLCEYARLKLNLDSDCQYPPSDPSDQSDPSISTSKWDMGYSATARFLLFIESKVTPNFIKLLVHKASTRPFSTLFFNQITGQSVHDLFHLYAGFKVHKGEFKKTACSVINKSKSQTFEILCPDPISFLTSILLSTLNLVYPDDMARPRIDQLCLFVEDMEGVAHCIQGPIPFSNHIHLSASYISATLARTDTDTARFEMHGVVLHEMVHVVQTSAFGTVPSALIEGIADYFRLIAGFPAISWRPKKGAKWTNGYADCAYFLRWIEEERGREGFVVKLNQALMYQSWSKELWTKLVGGDIDDLFKIFDDSLTNT